MIITRINEGLGNQLFRYAVGRCLAYRLNTELKLDIRLNDQDNNSHHSQYKLSAFNIQENIAIPEEIKNMNVITQDWNNAWVFMPEILDAPNNTYLQGWWQSEKYFLEIENILRRELTLKNPLTRKSSEWKEKILSSNCPVSIHVRHGDYLSYSTRYHFRLLPPRHYLACVNELKSIYSDINVFVFSDDIQWCRENLKFGVSTEFVEGCEYDYEEMYLMSLCKHNIISQSTFAWWGAWLNQNPDKKVFAPCPWHIYEPKGKDIIPDGWLKILSTYPVWMSPLLSIIFYVEDNLSDINISLPSLFSQNAPNYEIILIDTSTDGSDEFCIKAAGKKGVTLLTIDDSATKFAAWNRALNVARGDFVLFLTAKDVILSNTVQRLSVVCDTFFSAYAYTRKNYLTHATYRSYLPNIICTTSFFEEDPHGLSYIDVIPSKNFSVKADALFKDVTAISVLHTNFSSDEKLDALAKKEINALINTKFFKRDFLNENYIRFSDSKDIDAELTFVVESFLKTSQITFISNTLVGRLK